MNGKTGPDARHPSYDSSCPIIVGTEAKLKKKIPFYQRLNAEAKQQGQK